MRTVTKRELNQQTAQVLDSVSDEAVVVTEHGVPRWRIEAIVADEDPIARLRRLGQLSEPAADPAPWPRRSSHPDPTRVDRLIQEIRGDR